MRLTDESAQRYRNERIVALKKAGKTQVQIADLLDCSQAWVSKLLKFHRTHGTVDTSDFRQKPGPKCGLTPTDLEQLKKDLKQGALAHGFRTDNWTRERISTLIGQKFGVHYHPAHISRLMRKIGFSVQKPKRRSYRKDMTEVTEWKEERFPAAKKKPKTITTR